MLMLMKAMGASTEQVYSQTGSKDKHARQQGSLQGLGCHLKGSPLLCRVFSPQTTFPGSALNGPRGGVSLQTPEPMRLIIKSYLNIDSGYIEPRSVSAALGWNERWRVTPQCSQLFRFEKLSCHAYILGNRLLWKNESILHDNAVRGEVKRSNFCEALSCPGSLISQFIHLFTWLRHFITLFETGNMVSNLIF